MLLERWRLVKVRTGIAVGQHAVIRGPPSTGKSQTTAGRHQMAQQWS
jgi:hypothetical protein